MPVRAIEIARMASGDLQLRYTRRVQAGPVQAEASEDLLAWVPIPLADQDIEMLDGDEERVTALIRLGEEDRRFVRLRVLQP